MTREELAKRIGLLTDVAESNIENQNLPDKEVCRAVLIQLEKLARDIRKSVAMEQTK